MMPRRLHYGSSLLAVIREFCAEHGRDLESNLFWRAMGFRCYGVWEKGKRNHVGMKASDDINLWAIEFRSGLFVFDDLDDATPVIRVPA